MGAGNVNFKTIIVQLSGVSAAAADADYETWVINGCDDVINRIKLRNPLSAIRFLEKSADISASVNTETTATAIANTKEVALVTRAGYVCREEPEAKFNHLTDTSSIHYASTLDPAFIVRGNGIFVFPDVTVDDTTYYYTFPNYTVTNIDGTSSISNNFPLDYIDHVLLYAAIQNLEVRINDYLEDDEDIELINASQAQLGAMKQRYEMMFGGA